MLMDVTLRSVGRKAGGSKMRVKQTIRHPGTHACVGSARTMEGSVGVYITIKGRHKQRASKEWTHVRDEMVMLKALRVDWPSGAAK